MKTITIRELRSILFDIDDQNLTVGELRRILCNSERQDEQFHLNQITVEANRLERESRPAR